MFIPADSSDLKNGSVIRVFSTRRGLGRKAVIHRREPRLGQIAIIYLLVRADGARTQYLDETFGETYFNRKTPVNVEGIWKGKVKQGARGSVEEITINGEAKVATSTTRKRSSKSGSSKSSTSKKSASSKSKSNGGEKSRASNEELDRLAAKVVDLRDNKDKSWGEIEEALDIPPSRLRALYNRGGGEPTRQRKGAAKKAADEKAKSSSSKKTGTKGKKRPS